MGLILQVLQVSTTEILMSNNLNLPLSRSWLRDNDVVAQIPYSSVDLDLVVEEFLKGRDIEDLVGCWLRSIDYELRMILPVSLLLFHYSAACIVKGCMLEIEDREGGGEARWLLTFLVVLLCLPFAPRAAGFFCRSC